MKSIITVVLAFITLGATAQKDPAAKSILDKVSAKFKTLSTVKANYSLNVTDRNGKNAGKKAGLIYLKGVKYVITEKSMEITSDGRKIWKYEPAANEVNVSDVDNSSTAITPAKLFTNFYDKDFIYKLNGTKTVAGKQVAEIELTPIDKRRSFFKIYVYVDEKQQMIVSSKIYDNSGIVYDYSISNLQSNKPIDDKMFTFDKAKHPGVEVIEQ